MKHTVTEIKKALYKEKPVAVELETISGGGEVSDGGIATYIANTSLGNVVFRVPYSEMGEEKFEEEVPAQLLIRWLCNTSE